MSCGVTAPKGFVAAGVHCGLKKRRLDLSIIASTADEPSTLAAVFTRNQVQAGSRSLLPRGPCGRPGASDRGQQRQRERLYG